MRTHFYTRRDSEGASRSSEECCSDCALCSRNSSTQSKGKILKSTIGFDCSFAISSEGRSGGLSIFWNNNVRVEILPYSQYHIDAIITENREDAWRFTCVYGEARMGRHIGCGA